MPDSSWSAPTRRHLPIILIRGFGGLTVEDEKALAYQGFNDGSVYPQKRGENYIYEGLILRLLKHRRQYYDATNVVGYFASPVTNSQPVPKDLTDLDPDFFSGHKVVIDAGMASRLLQSEGDPFCTVWVFRYYDLNDRTFAVYGEALVRLIQFIQALLQLKQRADPAHRNSPLKVNIVAHSMGGLIVRDAIQRAYPQLTGRIDAADQAINKVVTLGTPHKGISFQLIRELRWLGIEAEDELKHFNPNEQKEQRNPAAWVNLHKHFPLERLLTVIGTNFRSYGVRASTWANRLFAVGGEYGPNYNRSDGLVKQAYAQIDGAPRTFVHKCHGGFDSLVTSRETYEITTRFFNGNVRARLRLIDGKIKRGFDWIGKSEFFLGVSIEPRRVDFELFHQSKEAENCYGPVPHRRPERRRPRVRLGRRPPPDLGGLSGRRFQAAARSGLAHRLLRRRARSVRDRLLGQRGLLQAVLRARDLQGRPGAVPLHRRGVRRGGDRRVGQAPDALPGWRLALRGRWDRLQRHAADRARLGARGWSARRPGPAPEGRGAGIRLSGANG
jgi:PGAP1-like protein